MEKLRNTFCKKVFFKPKSIKLYSPCSAVFFSIEDRADCDSRFQHKHWNNNYMKLPVLHLIGFYKEGLQSVSRSFRRRSFRVSWMGFVCVCARTVYHLQ